MRPRQLSSTQRDQSNISFGFSLIEAILSIAVFALITTSLVGSIVYATQSAQLSGDRNKAIFLAQEGIEAVRNIRDADFSNLSDGTFGLATTSNIWQFSGSSNLIGKFTRQITIGSVDSNTKSVSSTVSWIQNLQRTGSVSLVTRLTNWAAEVLGDWSNPTLAGTLDISGNNNGWKVQISGDYAYVVRDGGSPNFIIVNISTPSSPSITGSLNLSGNPLNIYVIGNYAYIASESNAQELQVINITTPSSPSQVGSFNAPGNDNGLGIYVVGTRAYLVTKKDNNNSEFFVLDVTTPSAPTQLGKAELVSDANEVYVSGNYAYIASDSNSQELQVVNISTPSTPTLVASLNLSGNQNAETISGFGSTVVLGRDNGDFLIVNVSNPLSPTLTSTFDAGSRIRDIALDFANSNKYAFIVSDENSAEFQVVDLTNLSSPALLSSLDLSSDQNGVAYSTTGDLVVLVGEENSEEVAIITPQ